MNGTDRTTLSDILRAIEEKRYTYEEIIQCLSDIIEAEYEKGKEANLERINACEDLIWQMETGGKDPFVSRKERYLDAVHAQVKIRKSRPALRLAAALAAVFVAAVIGTGIFKWQWFTSAPTHDGQQHTIIGHEIDVQLIQNSIASREEFAQFSSSQMDEIIDFLGFDPQIPEVLLDDLKPFHYYAAFSEESINLSMSYGNADGRRVLFVIVYFTEQADAYYAFEQDREENMKNINGIELYISENVDRLSAVWLNHATMYRLDGNLTHEEAIRIIKDVTGEYK